VKRLALFTVTVFFPCGLLVVFGFVMVRQDRELAARHAEDQQRAQAIEQHQQRVAQLEKWKRAAVEDFFAGRQPSVDFAALVVDDRILAPWQDSRTALPSLDACERAEFAAGKLTEAIACYNRALTTSHDPRQESYDRLLLGRALAKSGDTTRANQVDLDLLRAPLAFTDDQGIPFVYYAADRLLRNGTQTHAVADRFQHEPPAFAHSPPAAYLLRSIAERLGVPHLLQQANQAIESATQAASLSANLPGLLSLLRRDSPEPTWIDHGPWLIGLAKAPESGKELLLGIAASRLPADAPTLPLSPAHPRTGIYIASLCLVFLMVVSGAYLLWRDVRRDLEVADLRSQFVSSVSHELKTPLAAIRMFAETLRLRPDARGYSRDEYLDTIINESERLSRLVDNVLDFSKIEQGRKLYRLQPTSPAAVVDAVVRVAQYPLEQAGFLLRVHAGDPLPEISADADALQQAMLNLVMNAVKYSCDRKEIDIDVRCEDQAVVLAVRDYGIGIPVEYRQRIFERFFRVPSPDNLSVPGAGLGLTLVAHIAKAHGGEVQVESNPGTGSLFALRLPVGQHA
jgi:signal transduction histidine kinase